MVKITDDVERDKYYIAWNIGSGRTANHMWFSDILQGAQCTTLYEDKEDPDCVIYSVKCEGDRPISVNRDWLDYVKVTKSPRTGITWATFMPSKYTLLLMRL